MLVITHALYICILEYLYAMTYSGPYSAKEYWAILFTPSVYTDSPHCLYVNLYTTRHLIIHQVSLDDQAILLLDTGKGLGEKFHKIYVDVQPMSDQFYFKFSWINLRGSSYGYLAALSEIHMMSGNCQTLKGRYR